MATAPSPPQPPPPPKPCGNQPRSSRPPPPPENAALPFTPSLPVQETSPSPMTVHDAEDAALLPGHGSQSPPSDGQEDGVSGGKESNRPVQETDPAPQMTEQRGEEADGTDQADEDQ